MRAAEITVLTSRVSCLLQGLTLTASDPNRTELPRLLFDRRWILDFGFRFGCVLVLVFGWYVNGFDARDALESPPSSSAWTFNG